MTNVRNNEARGHSRTISLPLSMTNPTSLVVDIRKDANLIGSNANTVEASAYDQLILDHHLALSYLIQAKTEQRDLIKYSQNESHDYELERSTQQTKDGITASPDARMIWIEKDTIETYISEIDTLKLDNERMHQLLQQNQHLNVIGLDENRDVIATVSQSTLDSHLLLSFAHDLSAISNRLMHGKKEIQAKRRSLDSGVVSPAVVIMDRLEEQDNDTFGEDSTLTTLISRSVMFLNSYVEKFIETESRLMEAEARLRGLF